MSLFYNFHFSELLKLFHSNLRILKCIPCIRKRVAQILIGNPFFICTPWIFGTWRLNMMVFQKSSSIMFRLNMASCEVELFQSVSGVYINEPSTPPRKLTWQWNITIC